MEAYSRPAFKAWALLAGQFGHGHAQLRRVRRFLIDSLQRVQAVDPEATLEVANGGVVLLPSNAAPRRDQ